MQPAFRHHMQFAYSRIHARCIQQYAACIQSCACTLHTTVCSLHMVVCRTLTLSIPASTPTMTHCNPMESATLMYARSLYTTVCRLRRMQAACIPSGASAFRVSRVPLSEVAFCCNKKCICESSAFVIVSNAHIII